MPQLTEKLLPRAAGNLLDFHAGQRERVRDRHHWRGSGHTGHRRGHHLVDKRRLQGPLDAAAHQVAQGDPEDVLRLSLTFRRGEGGGGQSKGRATKTRRWDGEYRTAHNEG